MTNAYTLRNHFTLGNYNTTITRQESRWGDEEPTEVMGIRFRIN